MSHMEQQIIDVLKELKSQPIFQLSLADKELFHSNFLAWLAEQYREDFCQILINLGLGEDVANNLKDTKSIIVKREYQNFDFSLLKTDGPTLIPVFVLENKNKSIPYLSQCEEYTEKLRKLDAGNCPKLLLSLATAIPERKKIEEDGWKIVSYKDLGLAMRISPEDCYHSALINDYRNFVQNLHKLSSALLDLRLYDINNQLIGELKDCRLDDLAQKLRYSSYALKLMKLGKEKNINIKLADTKDIKKQGNTTRSETLFASHDYTSRGGATGIIQLARIVKDNYALKIQVQGESYRHALEWLGDSSKCSKQKMKEMLQEYDSFFNEEAFAGELFDKEDKVLYPISNKKVDKNSIKDYNHFGLGFQYRYKKLKAGLTSEDLLNYMIEDINRYL